VEISSKSGDIQWNTKQQWIGQNLIYFLGGAFLQPSSERSAEPFVPVSGGFWLLGWEGSSCSQPAWRREAGHRNTSACRFLLHGSHTRRNADMLVPNWSCTGRNLLQLHLRLVLRFAPKSAASPAAPAPARSPCNP